MNSIIFENWLQSNSCHTKRALSYPMSKGWWAEAELDKEVSNKNRDKIFSQIVGREDAGDYGILLAMGEPVLSI